MAKKWTNKASITLIFGTVFIPFGVGFLIFGAIAWGIVDVTKYGLRKQRFLQCCTAGSQLMSSASQTTRTLPTLHSDRPSQMNIKGDRPPATHVDDMQIVVINSSGLREISLEPSKQGVSYDRLNPHYSPKRKLDLKCLDRLHNLIDTDRSTTMVATAHLSTPHQSALPKEISCSAGGGDSMVSQGPNSTTDVESQATLESEEQPPNVLPAERRIHFPIASNHLRRKQG